MQYLNNAFQQPFTPVIWKLVNGKEIYEISKNLKWKKSFGYDEVPVWIVKLSIPFILSPLIFIINKMLSSGIFSSRLKFSQISHIFKKGNKTEISAYRPVSLLTSFSKIFEKVIYNRLIQHAQVNYYGPIWL
jgi:Notch-like protein